MVRQVSCEAFPFPPRGEELEAKRGVYGILRERRMALESLTVKLNLRPDRHEEASGDWLQAVVRPDKVMRKPGRVEEVPGRRRGIGGRPLGYPSSRWELTGAIEHRVKSIRNTGALCEARDARVPLEIDERRLVTYLSGANSRRIRKALRRRLGEEITSSKRAVYSRG